MLERAAAVADSLPFLLLSPPLPSSFPVFLPSRCLSSSLPPCQPAGPVTLPPHFRASRIHTSAAVAPCPRLSPIIPRQRKTKRRRNKYSPGRKRGRRGGKGSTLQLSMTYYFFRSPTPLSSPLPFSSLWRKILSRFTRFSLLPCFVELLPVVASMNELLPSFWIPQFFLIQKKNFWIFS